VPTIDAVVTAVSPLDGEVVLRDAGGREHVVCDEDTWRALAGGALLGPLVGWIVSLALDPRRQIVSIRRLR
jgi:hypothetical protein